MSTRTFNLDWGATGATLYYTIYDNSDTALVARTNTGVTESPAGSGLYRVTISGWESTWAGRIVWDDGTRFAEETFEAGTDASGSSGSSSSIASLVFNRAITVAGVDTDADSTPTISIVRLDTNATVLATTSTGVTHPSTGHYSYTLSSPVSGVTYRATWTFIVNGQTISASSDQTAAVGAWYYADQADVTDLIGSTALALISNAPGTAANSAIDTTRLTRTGQLVDALMDAELSRLGFTVPLANMSDATALILAQVNAGLVVRELNNPRAILSPAKGKSLSEIDKRLLVAIGGAENTWRRIKLGLVQLSADRAFDRTPTAAVYVPTWSSNTSCGRLCLP